MLQTKKAVVAVPDFRQAPRQVITISAVLGLIFIATASVHEPTPNANLETYNIAKCKPVDAGSTQKKVPLR
jgi:hypothetical protein